MFNNLIIYTKIVLFILSFAFIFNYAEGMRRCFSRRNSSQRQITPENEDGNNINRSTVFPEHIQQPNLEIEPPRGSVYFRGGLNLNANVENRRERMREAQLRNVGLTLMFI
uniref:Secreted protein n=1 Tax=Meloidogyne hapla TaxID=6305 RepID=A0A1I8B8R1_MELHA